MTDMLLTIERETAMDILLWILFGLVAGALAKWIMPGRDPGGILVTILLGIAGAVLGGFLGRALGIDNSATAFDVRSMLIAIAGALLLLFVYRLLTARVVT